MVDRCPFVPFNLYGDLSVKTLLLAFSSLALLLATIAKADTTLDPVALFDSGSSVAIESISGPMRLQGPTSELCLQPRTIAGRAVVIASYVATDEACADATPGFVMTSTIQGELMWVSVLPGVSFRSFILRQVTNEGGDYWVSSEDQIHPTRVNPFYRYVAYYNAVLPW